VNKDIDIYAYVLRGKAYFTIRKLKKFLFNV